MVLYTLNVEFEVLFVSVLKFIHIKFHDGSDNWVAKFLQQICNYNFYSILQLVCNYIFAITLIVSK